MGGFETGADGTLGGGIAATGNYPGKARTMAELRADLEQLWKLLPGAAPPGAAHDLRRLRREAR